MRCNTFQDCQFKAVQMSASHAKECERMREGLQLDEGRGEWVCTYPVRRDLAELPNNKYQAIKQAAQLENRLRKQGRYDEFHAVVMEGVQRGVYRELTEEEEAKWEGPVHYTIFTETYKAGPEATTPIRVCSNSSLSYKGSSLNDFLVKGPVTINNILTITLGFRFHQVGYTRDIRKFYQCV